MSSVKGADVSIERPNGAVIHCGNFERVYIRTKRGYIVVSGSTEISPVHVFHDPDVPLEFFPIEKKRPGQSLSFGEVQADVLGARSEGRAG